MLIRFAALVGVCALLSQALAAKDVVMKKPAPQFASSFRMRVQPQELFPSQQRSAASEAVVENGLEITIQPEKTSFAATGPLAIDVTLKNVSDQPITLFQLDQLGKTPTLSVANQNTGKSWIIQNNQHRHWRKEQVANQLTVLPPQKSVKYTLVVQSTFVGIPQPRPIPRPLPEQPIQIQPFPAPKVKAFNNDKQATPAEKDPNIGKGKAPVILIEKDRRRPAIWPVRTQVLPCGSGTCTATVTLAFVNPQNKLGQAVWTGKLASKSVSFEVEKLQNPPVINPPIVGPINQQQAVTLAARIAENALTQSLKSSNLPNQVAPPKQWIANPQQSAKVEKNNSGGWTISWTKFAERVGFNYNIKIEVSPNRQTAIKEVFTSFTSR